MTTTRSQGQAIAHLMSELRPDWDYAGCLAAVGAVKHKHPLDVAMAAIRLAAKAEARTPAPLRDPDGSHWKEKVGTSVQRQPPRREQECRRHPGEWSDACRPCSAERIAKAEEEPPIDLAPGADVRALIKAQLAQHNANVCPHHVLPARCGECGRQPKEAPAHLSATTEETA